LVLNGMGDYGHSAMQGNTTYSGIASSAIDLVLSAGEWVIEFKGMQHGTSMTDGSDNGD